MSGYILSILGIVVSGIIIDIVLPTGSVNKYIKSVYSIFVVAVLLMPLIRFINNSNGLELSYTDYELQENLLNYIYKNQVDNLEIKIEDQLSNNGFYKIDIELGFSIENNELNINSCKANLENLSISLESQHINKYEFIKKVVTEFTNLSSEEITICEWKRKKEF